MAGLRRMGRARDAAAGRAGRQRVHRGGMGRTRVARLKAQRAHDDQRRVRTEFRKLDTKRRPVFARHLRPHGQGDDGRRADAALDAYDRAWTPRGAQGPRRAAAARRRRGRKSDDEDEDA